MPSLFLLLAACGGQSGENGFTVPTCPEASVPTTLDNNSAGFSANDALAALGTTHDLDVSWGEFSYGPTATTFTVTIADPGTPELVEHLDGREFLDCELGTSLRVPVTLTVSGDDGRIGGEFPGQVDAWAADPTEIRFGLTETTGPDLDPTLVAEVSAWIRETEPDATLTDWHFDLGGTTAAGSVWLDVFYVTADKTVAQSVLNGGWGTE